MSDYTIIEPVGPCPISGYPLVAVHETTGCHAGIALAVLEEAEAHKRPEVAAEGAPPPLPLHELATAPEMFRSWSELLIFAVNAHLEANPMQAQRDYDQCQDVLANRHHYDVARIVASVHIAAMQYVQTYDVWAAPELVLVPDVGVSHVRTTAQTAVRRLAGGDDTIPAAVDQLRRTYLQRLAAA